MTYDWRLLAYYIRKPCAACKLTVETQEWLYQQYQARRPIKEIEGELLLMGYHIGDHTLYKHRKHQAILIERLSQHPQTDRARIERDILKSQIETLKLTQTREQAIDAALQTLKRNLTREQFQKIIRALREDNGV